MAKQSPVELVMAMNSQGEEVRTSKLTLHGLTRVAIAYLPETHRVRVQIEYGPDLAPTVLYEGDVPVCGQLVIPAAICGT